MIPWSTLHTLESDYDSPAANYPLAMLLCACCDMTSQLLADVSSISPVCFYDILALHFLWPIHISHAETGICMDPVVLLFCAVTCGLCIWLLLCFEDSNNDIQYSHVSFMYSCQIICVSIYAYFLLH